MDTHLHVVHVSLSTHPSFVHLVIRKRLRCVMAALNAAKILQEFLLHSISKCTL